MAPKSRILFSTVHTLIIAMSLVSFPLAQTPRERIEVRQPAAQWPQRAEVEKGAANELERKALAMIDELVAEAISLSLARNRIHVLTLVSDLLWPRDEQRARALVREAMNQTVAHMREAKESSMREDGRHFDASYSSRMVLDVLVRWDAKMILEFLPLIKRSQVNEFRLATCLTLLSRVLGAEARGYAYSRSGFPGR